MKCEEIQNSKATQEEGKEVLWSEEKETSKRGGRIICGRNMKYENKVMTIDKQEQAELNQVLDGLYVHGEYNNFCYGAQHSDKGSKCYLLEKSIAIEGDVKVFTFNHAKTCELTS